MYILTPINIETIESRKYWVYIDDARINGIWDEVVNPIKKFVNDVLANYAEDVLAAPIEFIRVKDAAEKRKLAIGDHLLHFPVEGDFEYEEEHTIFDLSYVTAIIATTENPSTTVIVKKGSMKANKLTDNRLFDNDLTVALDPVPCHLSSAAEKHLEAEIHEFFLATICQRIFGCFIAEFPGLIDWNNNVLNVNQCPENIRLAKSSYNLDDASIAHYLSSPFLTLRMENFMFAGINDNMREMVKKHAHDIGVCLTKKNLSFITSVNCARSDKFDLVGTDYEVESFFPIIPMLLNSKNPGNTYTAVNVYYNGELFEEFDMDMFGDSKSPEAWMYKWYEIAEKMQIKMEEFDEYCNEHTDDEDFVYEEPEWALVMVDLIHGA